MNNNNLKIKVIGVLCEPTTNPTANQNFANSILHCRRRLEWTRDWIQKNRHQFRDEQNIIKEIQFRSNETYHLNCFLNITEKQFRYMISKLGPVITKHEPYRKKKFFSAEERLAITLKYLATGEFHSCRQYSVRASKPVILSMIGNICMNIYECLNDEFIASPKTESDWKEISDEFNKEMNFPNCLGSLAMKHMVFTKPNLNFKQRRWYDDNYDTEETIVVTTIVDSQDNFRYVDMGQKCSINDRNLFEKSNIKNEIEGNILNLPKLNEPAEIGYHFVGHKSLPLKSYLMKTINQTNQPAEINRHLIWGTKEFEYISAIENIEYKTDCAFRMLTNIFPVLRFPLAIDSANAKKITFACIALYNFLRKTDQSFHETAEKIKCEDEKVVEDEEELRELEENSPNIFTTNCFRSPKPQLGDDEAADAKRKWLIDYLYEHRHERSNNGK